MGREKERAALKKVYRGRRWVMKINRMTDDEVLDTYKILKSQRKVK